MKAEVFGIGSMGMAFGVLLLLGLVAVGCAADSTLDSQDSVLHVKATMEFPDGAWSMEIWIDEKTGDARMVDTPDDEKDQEITVRRGNTYSSYSVDSGYTRTRIALDETEQELRGIHDRLWAYRDALARGAFENLGEEEIAGRKTIKIQVDGMTGVFSRVVTFLDSETQLPVRQVFYDRDESGRLQEIGIIETTYDVIEYIPRASLVNDFFELPAPPADAGFGTYVEMTVKDAGRFVDFDLYYLGSEFDGIPLWTIDESRTKSSLPDGPATHTVQMIYMDEEIGPSRMVGVGHRLVGSIEQWDDLSLPHRQGTEVDIGGGRKATLYQAGSTQLELTLGNVVISIGGADEDQVVRAAQALQKLN